MLNKLFLLFALCPFVAHAQTVPTPKTKNTVQIEIDPLAVKFMDRTAKLYGHVKTLHFKATGQWKDTNGLHSTWTRLTYATGNRLRLEEKGTFRPSLTFINGRKVALFDGDDKAAQPDQFEMAVPNALDAREAVDSAGFPIGRYLSKWLFGRHTLQKGEDEKMLAGNLQSLKVAHLSPRRVGTQMLEGIRFQARYTSRGQTPGATWGHTLWFLPRDARLMRIDYESTSQGDKTQGYMMINEQQFNAAIPASTFAFKNPKG